MFINLVIHFRFSSSNYLNIDLFNISPNQLNRVNKIALDNKFVCKNLNCITKIFVQINLIILLASSLFLWSAQAGSPVLYRRICEDTLGKSNIWIEELRNIIASPYYECLLESTVILNKDYFDHMPCLVLNFPQTPINPPISVPSP